MTSIEIPDSVTSIGRGAFEICRSLTTITYNGTMAEWNAIEKGLAWNENTGLYTVYCTDSEAGKPASEGLEYSVNSDGKTCTITGIGTCTDTDIIIGEYIDGYRVTEIGCKAFISSVHSLTGIEIPDGVTHIGEMAFGGCSNLKKIGIPDSVTSIGDGAFKGCRSLTNIEIPDGVTMIDNGMFYECISLTSIEIPASVTSIGQFAFWRCSSLTSIEIPDSVTSIGRSAFEICSSLTTITYNGTMAEWNEIFKEDFWDVNTGSYTIYCTDGEIKK